MLFDEMGNPNLPRGFQSYYPPLEGKMSIGTTETTTRCWAILPFPWLSCGITHSLPSLFSIIQTHKWGEVVAIIFSTCVIIIYGCFRVKCFVIEISLSMVPLPWCRFFKRCFSCFILSLFLLLLTLPLIERLFHTRRCAKTSVCIISWFPGALQ